VYVRLSGFLVLPLTATLIYAVLVLVIAYALAFPGFGVVLLPQPILRLYAGGKTVLYDVTTPYTALWLVYLLLVHAALYWVARLARVGRPYLLVAPLLYAVNLALVLAGLCDHGLPRYVYTYTVGYLGLVPGALLTLVVELAGYSLAPRTAR
jgi:glucan phosphoethanolaminetransferase (alkaline phosphatase superfamily)